MSIATPTPHLLMSPRRWLAILFSFFVLLLLGSLIWRSAHAAAPSTRTPAIDPPNPPDDAAVLRASVASPDTHAQTDERTPVIVDSPAAPPPDFAQMVDHLVELGESTATLLHDDNVEAARANDAAARKAFVELMNSFPDAGERALDLASSLPAEPTQNRDAARQVVLQLVVSTECARRGDAAEAAGDHRRIDQFVQTLLDMMPQSRPLADMGAKTLDGKPFLRLCHEPTVLQLVDLAGKEQFERSIATHLLLTLWDNLQRSGERSSAELASLAMVLLADSDPSKRTAAFRLLLRDGRYRPVVLAWLREHTDATVAAEVANLAARELEPTEALSVLRELAPLLANMPGAYMALGFRAPDTLSDAYRELLAANMQPAIRTDLVAGLALADADHALPIAELAQTSDPSPEVRVQAMLTLSAAAAESRGEQACSRALDDPAIATNPTRLAVVVFALQNLEAAGLTNAVDRLGQRLRAAPLREDTRLELEQLLARALPGGRTSNGPSNGQLGAGGSPR